MVNGELSQAELLLSPLAFGNIAVDRLRRDGPPLLVANESRSALNRYGSAVLAQELGLKRWWYFLHQPANGGGGLRLRR